MAESYTEDLNRIKSEMGKIQAQVGKNMDDLDKKTKSYANSWSEVGKKITDSFDPVARSGKLIAQLQAQQADSASKQQGFEQREAEVLNTHTKFRADLARYDELTTLNSKGLNESQNRELQQLQEVKNKQLAISKLISDRLKDAQANVAEQKKEQAGLEQQIDGEKKRAAQLAIIKETFKAIYQMTGEYDKFLSDQAKILGVSKDTIDAQYESIQKNNTATGYNLASNRQILEAQTKLVQSYAITGQAAESIATNIAQTAKSTGLTVDEASKLNETLAEIGGTSLDAQKNMAGFAIQAAKAYGVPLNVLLKDVMNASSSVRLIFKGNTEELIKQAAEARKLGTSLDAAAKSAEALLDFESSIGAELKASALLGQSLNFNESRRLAFAGDLIGAEKALQLEIEKVGDLDKLNYNQRKALAQATGKDFAELQKIETQKKNQLEIEKRFPQEAAKVRKLQEELNTMQKKSKEDRDAEYKKILDQQKVEAESALLNQQKAAAMDRIGQALKPIYEFANRIQAAFYQWVAGLNKGLIITGLIVTAFVAIGIAVGGAALQIYLLGKFSGKAAELLGAGVGRGLMGLSAGVRTLGRTLQTFPVGKLIGIAAALAIVSLAAIGFATAFQMMREVTVGDAALLVGSLVAIGIVLFVMAQAITATLPQFGILIGVMLGVALAAVGFGYAISLTTPAITAVGAALTAAAPIFATMLGIFTALPAVVLSVAAALIGLALASPGLLGAALGIGAVGLALSGMVVSLALFPTNELTRIATQLVGLSAAASGIGVAAASLNQLSGIELPTIDIGGLEAAALGIDAVGVAMVALGVTLASFPTSELTRITTQLVGLSEAASGIGVAVASLKQLSGIELPTIDIGGLAAVSLLGGGGKKEENSEIKAGLEALGAKFDALTNMMASGGIVVNLDGTKVNNALARSASTRGAYGQATIV